MKHSFHKYLYFTSVFLLMCSLYNLSFTWNIHRAVWSGMASFFSLTYMMSNRNSFKANRKKQIISFLLVIWYIYATSLSPNVLGAFVLNITTFIPIYSIVYSSIAIKKEMLRFMGLATSLILALSLVGWFLYLIGVDLPHTYDYNFDDGYHSYVYYYVFLVVDRVSDILPRFTGMFIEPRQMASVCVLLILSYKIGNLPKWSLLIIVISLILSFSLAGWIAIVLGFFCSAIVSASTKTIISLSILSVFLIGLYFYAQKEQKSVLNTYIFSRLVPDEEKGIVGNNRTHNDFDIQYDMFVKSPDAMLGISKELSKGNNWTIGNAGHKVFIVHYGIMGFILMSIMLFAYYRSYMEAHSLIYLLTYYLLGCIRSFFVTPYWLILFILSIPLFAYNYKYQK